MATESRGTTSSIAERLVEEPWKYAFFQAVRLLEQCAAERMLDQRGDPVHSVGDEEHPARELVRFRALPSHTFPPGEIASIRPHSRHQGDVSSCEQFEMVVAFFGLFGPSGVLPHHYTQTVIDRLRLKDFALRDYLDLFNHRMLSLFFRAWEKYRFHVGYTKRRWQIRAKQLRGPVDPEEHIDTFQRCVYSLTGFGTRGLLHRLDIDNETLLFYTGLLGHRPRNAVSLEILLQDYFGLRMRIDQFQGQWLYLPDGDQTSLPSRSLPLGLNARLGEDTIVGQRVWSVQDKFRVRVGPLDFRAFCRFMPTGDRLRPLAQLTRVYVGPELDFDVQPVLMAREVPSLQFGAADIHAPRLGWNTWLQSRPRTTDSDDAIFVHEGAPSR
jgi:type VI secretion system protein ImpH